MKKSTVNEKNFKRSEWVVNTDPENRERILARNAKIRVEREAKSATMSTRIAPSDLVALKEIAVKKAIPYLTLLGSVIHQYVTGNLVELDEARKVLNIK